MNPTVSEKKDLLLFKCPQCPSSTQEPVAAPGQTKRDATLVDVLYEADQGAADQSASSLAHIVQHKGRYLADPTFPRKAIDCPECDQRTVHVELQDTRGRAAEDELRIVVICTRCGSVRRPKTNGQ
jgi:DNA-directed RNA polymerase subunit M/transcription elongation factor TFIIS